MEGVVERRGRVSNVRAQGAGEETGVCAFMWTGMEGSRTESRAKYINPRPLPQPPQLVSVVCIRLPISLS